MSNFCWGNTRWTYLELVADAGSAVMDEVQDLQRSDAQTDQQADIIHDQSGALPLFTCRGRQRSIDKIIEGPQVCAGPGR